MIQSLPRDQGQRLNIRGQGLGSEVICKYFVWTDRKHTTFHTVTWQHWLRPPVIIKVLKTVEKLIANVIGISYYIQTPRNWPLRPRPRTQCDKEAFLRKCVLNWVTELNVWQLSPLSVMMPIANCSLVLPATLNTCCIRSLWSWASLHSVSSSTQSQVSTTWSYVSSQRQKTLSWQCCTVITCINNYNYFNFRFSLCNSVLLFITTHVIGRLICVCFSAVAASTPAVHSFSSQTWAPHLWTWPGCAWEPWLLRRGRGRYCCFLDF